MKIKKFKIYFTKNVANTERYGNNNYDTTGIYINKQGVPFLYSYGIFNGDAYCNVDCLYNGHVHSIWLKYIPTEHSLKIQCKKLFDAIKN